MTIGTSFDRARLEQQSTVDKDIRVMYADGAAPWADNATARR
jgi:hypothetical protein